MPSKTSKWSLQEQILLKKLRDEQISRDYVNWQQIAKEINQFFNKTNRTSKQCREKYINFLKFGQKAQINLNWQDEQVSLLKKYYEEYGPSWSLISSKLKNRSQNSIKNKFNNSIRRAAKILCTYESDVLKKTKKSITFEVLVAMIDFINQLQKIINQMGFTINLSSTLFDFRSKILEFSLLTEETDNQHFFQLTRLIKTVNMRLRCFGVFKVKNRKHWKLSRKSLFSIQRFDKVVQQDLLKMDEGSNGSNKQQDLTINVGKNEDINEYSNDEISMDLIWQNEKVAPKTIIFREIRLQEQQMNIMGQENYNIQHQQHLFF